MSTAGTYQHWVKVLNPEAIISQMTSDNNLPPFHFGGSPVPEMLGVHRGGSLRKEYQNTGDKRRIMDVKGRGAKPLYEHTDRIILNKHYKRC